ncbi:bZIP transcription factor 29-like [Curcuma longa]|uniref:bZIP transcription factor 29-like n=1 Tax=Curcuma longa TaxID=136217 RepID=UPI003D9DF838
MPQQQLPPHPSVSDSKQLPPAPPPRPPAAQLSPFAAFHSHPFFSFDSSPAASLSDSVVPMGDRQNAPVTTLTSNGFPPRKAHRRSQSCDVPFAFLPPPAVGMKTENREDLGILDGDDLFDAYMDLEGFDALNSSEDCHSRDSGCKSNAGDSSDNEGDSNAKGLRALGSLNRTAAAVPGSATASRHCRSLSMDSFMGKFNFEEPPAELPLSGGLMATTAKVSSLVMKPTTFSLEFGNGQFTAPEMKKIMENEKLMEMAMADPKRVKRILANRQSAARSKERKMRYIAELEHKVQALQTETTTISAQLTLLQRGSAGLANQNNELKFRLQAMEQQAQLRDALNEALTAEVQRLKLAATGLADAHA